MSVSSCARHPATEASYRCEACASMLCAECVHKGHALFTCALCHERAIPLHGDASARPRDVERQAKRARPYALASGWLYPFRGLGLFLFLAMLVTLPLVALLSFGGGPRAWLVVGGYGSLVVGLQFKIVRSTSDGDDELPDWPEYMDWRERVGDLAAYALAGLWQTVPPLLFLLAWPQGVLRAEPLPPYWAAFAVLWWCSAAVFSMAFGATAIHGWTHALRIDRHLRALRAAGGDAVRIANLLFAGGAAIFLVRLALDDVPIAGAAVAGAIGAYWTLVSSHFIGLLFRRHTEALNAVYF